MDPGTRQDLVAVYNRVETQDSTGGTDYTLELVDYYWAAIVHVTKSTSFSGFERAKDVRSITPIPSVRFIFDLPLQQFDFTTVEFHYEGSHYMPAGIYVPTQPPIVHGSSNTCKLAYSCSRKIYRENL